jgi:hypothetical protein
MSSVRARKTRAVAIPAEAGKASAIEVEHADRGVGASSVLLDQRVPLAAVRATEFVARPKVSRFHASDGDRLA